MDVFHLGVPELGPLRELSIVFEQFAIMLQVAATATGIGNDCIKAVEIEHCDHFLCPLRCQFLLTSMRVQ